MQINAINNRIDFQQKKDLQFSDKQVKVGVAATTALTTGLALAHIAKRQGFSLSPSVIRKTPIKDWAIFKLTNKNDPSQKVIDIEAPEILELAAASVAGGLASGLLLDDKKYRKSKLRESVNQILGNVAVPVACVWATSKIYEPHKLKLKAMMPQIKASGKIGRYFNLALQQIPFAVTTIAALGTGIVAGNKVSNLLNEKVFHRKVDRKIKGTDFAPHVDDIGLAVSVMGDKGKFSSFIQRTVPAFLCVPGYQTGTHRD